MAERVANERKATLAKLRCGCGSHRAINAHRTMWPYGPYDVRVCGQRAVLKSTQTAQSHPNPIQRGPIAPPRVHMPVWLPMHWPRRRYRAIMRTAP